MNDIGSAARPESRSNYETYRVGDAIRPWPGSRLDRK
jgi:hypothetical protein